MKNQFKEICEAVNTTIKQTKIFRYPKQIKLSEEFIKALNKEIGRHMQTLDESSEPIRDLPEKFLKALRFELVEITEKKDKKQNQIDLKPRQKWDVSPVQKVHTAGKKDGYNRARQKKDWSKEG